MNRCRSIWKKVERDWPRWAQVAGLMLGVWQIGEWKVWGHAEPNIGVMSFAGALLLFQRAATSARARRDEYEDNH